MSIQRTQKGTERSADMDGTNSTKPRQPNSTPRQVVRTRDLPTKTDQGHKANCDINNLVNRYQREGQIPPPDRKPQYADVTAMQGDLTEVIDRSKTISEGAQKAYNKVAEERKNAKKSTQKDTDTSDNKHAKESTGKTKESKTEPTKTDG